MAFFTTRWSLVTRAATSDDGGRMALEELCTQYLPSVLAFYRRAVRSEADAEDLTQGLFRHLLERRDLATVDPARGRFRDWLLACARHWLSDRKRHDAAAKRGGGTAPIALDAATDALDETASSAFEPASATPTPEEAFAASWVQSLTDRVLEQLLLEFTSRGRQRVLAAARPWLVEGEPSKTMQKVAEEIGLSETAFKVSVHRARARFHELLRTEVAQTLDDENDLEDELATLLGLLGGPAERRAR